MYHHNFLSHFYRFLGSGANMLLSMLRLHRTHPPESLHILLQVLVLVLAVVLVLVVVVV